MMEDSAESPFTASPTETKGRNPCTADRDSMEAGETACSGAGDVYDGRGRRVGRAC